MTVHKTLLAATAALGSLLTLPALAVDLIAIGELPGNLVDRSGRSALLENGVNEDVLGGVGSGLAWAGGNTFLGLPDRGPNAVAWNSDLSDTTSYVPRFHTLQLDLAQRADTARGLPFTLTPKVTRTTLLFSLLPLNYGPAVPAGNKPWRHYFSGRSDNFDPQTTSADPRDARFDGEGIRLSRNGRFVFMSDEYGPYIHVFDRASGLRVHSIRLPANLAAAYKSSVGDAEITGNSAGRVANKGMEGLAISPDGRTLFGLVQSPLIEDGGDGGRANRIVKIDLLTGRTAQYVYDNYLADKAKTYNSSELLALNDHELLVLERDGKGLGDDSDAKLKRVYKVDIAGAEDVSALTGEATLLAKAPVKTLFLDILAKLTAAGLTAGQVPAKLEGMAFGADVKIDGVLKHTLYISNDNDFLAATPGGIPNPNLWYVFTFTDADLGGSPFVNQALIGGAGNYWH